MIRGFYTARSGLQAQQTNIDVISNNMANVNTVGFKSSKVSFTDLMYQNINRPAENEASVGHGVKVNKTDLTFTQGALEATNRVLDFALTDTDTFFAVQNANGDIEYTRAGNFIMSSDDGDTFYLATGDGNFVLDESGSEIEIIFKTEKQKDANGREREVETGEIDLSAMEIGVYRFPNPYGLTAVGNNRFMESENSGEAEALDEGYGLRNGYLEKAAVELSSEMTKVIEASKAFSFNSRMVQVADEVEQTVNNLR